MKLLIILGAILAASMAMPTGPTYYTPPKVYPVSRPALHTSYVPPAAARPSYYTRPFVTGNLYHSQDTLGQYTYGYSSSDGQAKTETKQVDGSVTGNFNYISPEGQNVQLAYSADHGGFRAAGAHLPQPPELPAEHAQAHYEAVQRLQQAHHEARIRGDVEVADPRYDDGSYKGEEFYTRTSGTSYAARPIYPAAVGATTYQHQAPAAPKTFYGTAPAPYSSSSYQANIGGGPVVVGTPAAAPAKSSYSYQRY